MDDFLSPHLALFVDVVDLQSFSAAARRRFAQPAWDAAWV
ncbi:helix-turn-helix domain-containing protein [Burkholderia stabilis]|uniref:Uncharacterized protein n=1 Tax=Burkholderia stabilis TaxID=95485 RepID=A0A1Y1BI41_9BURK|nr:LysR family transcriptional regulator [Burkholderia stabilis]BAX59582.1 hypothetical protein BSFP_024190 [Burkholderia stabilis]